MSVAPDGVKKEDVKIRSRGGIQILTEQLGTWMIDDVWGGVLWGSSSSPSD